MRERAYLYDTRGTDYLHGDMKRNNWKGIGDPLSMSGELAFIKYTYGGLPDYRSDKDVDMTRAIHYTITHLHV